MKIENERWERELGDETKSNFQINPKSKKCLKKKLITSQNFHDESNHESLSAHLKSNLIKLIITLHRITRSRT